MFFFSSSMNVCVGLCVVVHVCVVYVCALIHVCVEAKGRLPVSYSVMLHLIPLRQGLSLNLGLGWWPGSPQSPPPSPVLGLWAWEAMSGFLCGYWDLNSVLALA